MDNKPEENSFARRNISLIKNKKRRLEAYLKLKHEKQKVKKKERQKRQKESEALGKDAPPRQIPRTIENTREPDPTMVVPDDEEVQLDAAMDEMSSFFKRETVPKILITTGDNPHTKTLRLCRELRQSIPNCSLSRRKRASLKKIIQVAPKHEYTDIIVINEDRRQPDQMLLIHLPDGPTAYFKISGIKFCKDIKHREKLSGHRPEIILNNFNTRLGFTVGRMIASLFHYDPEFRGRKVVTFHNQRDYIFYRHHRYEFKDHKKVALKEIGPRFTLKLRSLQKGTFDSKYGEYDWILKRHEMETSRRRFFL